MTALRAFPTMLRVGFAELVAYRGEVFIWILTTTMPLIMYAMWSTIAREAPIGRFDEATFAAYFLSTLVVRQLASAWIVWELNYMIRHGNLSTVLLKPVHPLVFFAAQNLGAVPFRALILVPLAARPRRSPFSWTRQLMTAPAWRVNRSLPLAGCTDLADDERACGGRSEPGSLDRAFRPRVAVIKAPTVRPPVRGETSVGPSGGVAMRAEIASLVPEIEQGLALLRRRL